MHDDRAVPQVTYGWTHRAHARERAWNDQACFPRPIPGCPVHLRVMHDGRTAQEVTYGWTHRARAARNDQACFPRSIPVCPCHDDTCMLCVHAHECFLQGTHKCCSRLHTQECTRACSMMTHECFLQGTHTCCCSRLHLLRVHAHECFLLAYICSVYTHMNAFCQAHAKCCSR